MKGRRRALLEYLADDAALATGALIIAICALLLIAWGLGPSQ